MAPVYTGSYLYLLDKIINVGAHNPTKIPLSGLPDQIPMDRTIDANEA